ncbi:5'-nucleotidase domain-containing protein 1 [Macrosteles quadrilineatus]|uniref:5'-nucleotidase domain-containing protein 1 n=1 Tax=Macrosteles quadrilineatus TaxID=74068 RepID=UPI0023E185CE|nr:5'-nucleotidase domain-containing protein 1 [Macrosteles quadrilineatus]
MHLTAGVRVILTLRSGYGYTTTTSIRPICPLGEQLRVPSNLWRSHTDTTCGIHVCAVRTYSHLQSLGRTNANAKNCPDSRVASLTSCGKEMMSSFNKATTDSSVFRILDYDCVGFDLDNTLGEYNITPSVETEYNILANYLVKEKGYDPDFLLKPLNEDSIDFLQKGLFVDFARGNIIKITENGVISRASHGSKMMSHEEIKNAYGKDRKWEVTNELCQNMLVGWNGPLSERIRALLDYFDRPASIAFARIVDSLDDKLGKPADVYNVWPDVLAGLHDMYDREHFASEEGGYFKEIKSNPGKFLKPCSPETIKWLKEIKQTKLTYLITGSNCDFASLTAETVLGKDWRSLFDIVVCYARKPAFFTGCRPFIELDGFKETEPVSNNSIKLGSMYNQGNWQELYQLFAKTSGIQKPRCLYFGDNLVQDIYTPSKFTKCETVAVVEELKAETDRNHNGYLGEHPSHHVVTSKSWGSYFYDDKENMNTLWGSILHKHANICVPSLSVLAQYPLSHEFNTFEKCYGGGYFPSRPSHGPPVTEKKVRAV